MGSSPLAGVVALYPSSGPQLAPQSPCLFLSVAFGLGLPHRLHAPHLTDEDTEACTESQRW